MGGRAWALHAFESYFLQEIAGRDLGGTGEEHEDTGSPEPRGVEKKARRRQRESWPAT